MTFDHDTLFKVLDGTTSPVAVPPYRYPVGRWTKHLDPSALVPCNVGYHLARGPMVFGYLGTAIYVPEPCPEHGILESEGQLLTCRVRLTERVKTWNGRTARLFAADVAEAVLLSEVGCGREPDERSWVAVETARKYADRLVTYDDLDAARHTAGLAMLAADDTWHGAGLAAWVAARAAVGNDYAAVWYVVSSASDAAYDNAHRGTHVSTWRADRKAAKSAMFDRLLMYLNGAELPPVEPLYGPAMEVSTR